MAILAGCSLLIMAVLAGFAYGYVFSNIYVANDPIATATALVTSSGSVSFMLLGFLLILICDIVVSFALFQFFKQRNYTLAFYCTGMRLLYTVFLGLALKQLSGIRSILQSDTSTPVLLPFQAFLNTWSWGLILFGIHLLLLGKLLLQSTAPKTFGYLLLLGGVCYSISNSCNQFLPDYEHYIMSFYKCLQIFRIKVSFIPCMHLGLMACLKT